MTTDQNTTGYDSRPDTLLHSLRVGHFMVTMLTEGMQRSVKHDLSKTEPPEVADFDRMTPKLATLTYGSPEYAESLRELGPTLEHHYANNAHHPEHYPNGIDGMTLVDLLEMLADWRASTERMGGTGDLLRSIKHNTDRFKLSPQLVQILINTAEHFGMVPTPGEGTS